MLAYPENPPLLPLQNSAALRPFLHRKVRRVTMVVGSVSAAASRGSIDESERAHDNATVQRTAPTTR